MQIYREITNVPYNEDVIILAHTETIVPFLQGHLQNPVMTFDFGGRVLFAHVTEKNNILDILNAAQFISDSKERIYKFTFSCYDKIYDYYYTIKCDGITKQINLVFSQLNVQYIIISPGLKDVITCDKNDPGLVKIYGPILKALKME